VRFAVNNGKLFVTDRERVIADGHFRPDDFNSGSFIKRECSWGLSTPRAIVTFKPAVHAFAGPCVYFAARRFFESLRDEDGVLGSVITGEVNAEDFGEWAWRYSQELDIGHGVYFFHDDAEKMDAHIQRAHLRRCHTFNFRGAVLRDLEDRALRHLERGV